MSETPRTDAESYDTGLVLLEDDPQPDIVVQADFARTLERELSAVTRERDEARADAAAWSRNALERVVELRAERDALRLREISLQAQVNAFYSGTSDMRLLAMTRERDALRAEVERLRAVLAFYASKATHDCPIIDDQGRLARAALQEPTP